MTRSWPIGCFILVAILFDSFPSAAQSATSGQSTERSGHQIQGRIEFRQFGRVGGRTSQARGGAQRIKRYYLIENIGQIRQGQNAHGYRMIRKSTRVEAESVPLTSSQLAKALLRSALENREKYSVGTVFKRQ